MFKRHQIEIELDNEIAKLQELMSNSSGKETKEYATMVDQLVKLYELRHRSKFSKDVLISVAANFGGIVAVLGYERAHIVASKAFGLVKKIV